MACRRNRRDPSRRPRAMHAAFPSAFAAAQRDPKAKEKSAMGRI
jgi:hypothetical protein